MSITGNNATKDRWSPVRDGDTYCSPACGGSCKYDDYTATKNKADRVAEIMGHGWTPRVWENLGWHWSVVSPGKNIHVRSSGYRSREAPYKACISNRGCVGAIVMSRSHVNPHDAVAEAIALLEDKIAGLQSLRGF